MLIVLFFEPKSPFRILPPDLPPEQRVWIDAVRGSCDILNLSYRQLCEGLAHVTKNPLDSMAVVPASTADAWSFVDAVNRLRILLNRVPRSFEFNSAAFPEGHRELKNLRNAFFAVLNGVEAIRNEVQHLDEKIEKLASSGLPVWGYITWTYSEYDPIQAKPFIQKCVLRPGPVVTEAMALKNHVITKLELPVDYVELHAHGQTINLSQIRRFVESPVRFLERLLAARFGDRGKGGADVLIIADIEYKGAKFVPGSWEGLGRNRMPKQTAAERAKLEQEWIKEFFVFGCYLSAHEARSHYDAHNKATDPLVKKLHYTNLHTALALSYETLGAILIALKGWAADKDFIGHFLAYKQGEAYLSNMLPEMTTVVDFCKNFGIDKAAIVKHKLPAKDLDERLQKLVDDSPGVAKMQDERSSFYNKTKHGTAIVDTEKGPCAISIEKPPQGVKDPRPEWQRDLKLDILVYDAGQAKVFYNLCVRIALMMADLILLHYLSRYDTGYDELKKALAVHDGIVSITPEA